MNQKKNYADSLDRFQREENEMNIHRENEIYKNNQQNYSNINEENLGIKNENEIKNVFGPLTLNKFGYGKYHFCNKYYEETNRNRNQKYYNKQINSPESKTIKYGYENPYYKSEEFSNYEKDINPHHKHQFSQKNFSLPLHPRELLNKYDEKM